MAHDSWASYFSTGAFGSWTVKETLLRISSDQHPVHPDASQLHRVWTDSLFVKSDQRQSSEWDAGRCGLAGCGGNRWHVVSVFRHSAHLDIWQSPADFILPSSRSGLSAHSIMMSIDVTIVIVIHRSHGRTSEENSPSAH